MIYWSEMRLKLLRKQLLMGQMRSKSIRCGNSLLIQSYHQHRKSKTIDLIIFPSAIGAPIAWLDVHWGSNEEVKIVNIRFRLFA
jgi:hypothetical protein